MKPPFGYSIKNRPGSGVDIFAPARVSETFTILQLSCHEIRHLWIFKGKFLDSDHRHPVVLVCTSSYGQVVYDSILDRSAKTAGFKFDPTKQQPGVLRCAWHLKVSWWVWPSKIGANKNNQTILQFHAEIPYVFGTEIWACSSFWDKPMFLANRDHPYRGNCIT